jgi:hypothetical protein
VFSATRRPSSAAGCPQSTGLLLAPQARGPNGGLQTGPPKQRWPAGGPTGQKREAEGGFLPELTDLVGDGPFENDGSGWDTAVTGGTRLGDALRSSWERLQGYAKVNTTDDYEGLLVEPATTGAVDRQLQSALTKEVELVKHGELVAELVKLHQHDRRSGSRTRRSSRGSPASVWVTAWPTPTCRMSNIQLDVHAAWHVGVQVAGGAPSSNKC